MNSMGVRAVLTVLLLFIATVKAQEGDVEFSWEKVTMTCPLGEVTDTFTWMLDGKEIINKTSKTYEVEYDSKSQGLYSCKSKDGEDKAYYFYVKGRVCANCFELDGTVLGLVIVVDVIWTGFVMMVIYRCTKKKSSVGSTHTSKAPRSRSQAPPTPSPDYEQLNVHTRSQDTYSSVNRTG